MFKPPKDNIIFRILDFLHNHIIVVIIVVVALISAISVVILANTGDTSTDTTGTTGTTSNTEYKTSSTVFLPMHRIKSLNPLTSSDSDTYDITQMIYSSLFKLDSHLNVEEDLVSSYTTGSGKVYIKLKSGVKFSDGSSLTEGDVSYTVDKIKSIGSKSPYYTYANKISSVSGSGTELTIYFKNSSEAALDNLVFPIVSSSDYSTDSDYKPMGSGEYKYSSFNKKSYLKLVPNENYFADAPSNNIKFRLLKYSSKAMSFVTTDAITAYVSKSSNAKANAKDKDLKCKEFVSSEAEYLGFNFNNKVLSKKNIRQAIAYCINTKSLVEDNYGGSAVTGDTIYYPGFLGTKNQGDQYKYNQSKTLKMLKKAGYSDEDEDGILEDSKGKELTLNLLVNSNDKGRADAAGTIADELKSVGIDVQVKKEVWSSYKSDMASGNFDLLVGGYKFDKGYNLRDLFDKGNNLNYSNSVVVSAVDKLETTLTADEQKSAYKKLKSQLIDDLPYYCLCYKKYCFISVKNFKSDESPTFFDYYRGISTWNWKKAVTPDTASDTYKNQ